MTPMTLHPPSSTETPHAPTPRAYTWTLLSLLVLLAATVATADLPLGRNGLWLALIIATAKAALVLAVFMELAGASTSVRAAAVIALFTIGMLLGLTFVDVGERNRAVEKSGAPITTRPRDFHAP